MKIRVNPWPLLKSYYGAGFASTNDFTTMLLGCTPTGIMVSREYSRRFELGRSAFLNDGYVAGLRVQHQ